MKILIADDDQVNRLILQTFLQKWGYEVLAAQDGSEAWHLLEQPDPPRLATLDWMMPRMDGAQVCQEIRKRQKRLYTYVILLTAKGQKKDVVDGLEAGADDYVTKPFDSNELHSRLRAGLRILELEDQLIHARDLLHIEATHDALTGLWNRAAILEFLGKELSRAQLENSSIGVIMADLDHFKRVNDTKGHRAGDIVLQEMAQRMRSTLRPYDTIGRYGGEEFLVIAPHSDISNTLKQAKRLRRAVEATPVGTAEGPVAMTISLGVTASGEVGSAPAESLLLAADAALYKSKEWGRNRVESVKVSQDMAASYR